MRTIQNSILPFRNGVALVGACWAMGWAIAEWLSNPVLSMSLWPTDVNLVVGKFLGARITEDSVSWRLELSALAVTVRLTGLMLLVASLAWRRWRWSAPKRLSKSIRQTACLWLISCCWWPFFLLSDLLPGDGLAWFLGSSLPLWMMTTAAVTVWVWIRTDEQRSGVREFHLPDSGIRAILLVSMAAWIGVSFWMNERLYAGLLVPHGDSAMYEEHLWNIRHGKGFRSYLDQGLFLGEHIQVIHLLLLPLHMLWPSHLLLELAESVALGSCAIPLYRIARRHGASAGAAALLGMAWLLFYPMHFLDIAIDQKTFRPIALSLPFLFWMIDCAERRQFAWATVWMLVALSAKEDLALVTFPLGVVFALRAGIADRGSRRGNAVPGGPGEFTPKSGEHGPQEVRGATSDTSSDSTSVTSSRLGIWWGAGVAGISIFYLLLAVLIVIPAFRSGDAVHYARYFGDLGGSPSELVRTAMTEPGRVLARVFSFRTLLYLLVFTAPLGFVPWRRPLVLSAGVLTFGMLSLLQLGDDVGGFPPVPYHHFHAPLLPVLFWACAAACGERFRRAGQSALAGHATRWREHVRHMFGQAFALSGNDRPVNAAGPPCSRRNLQASNLCRLVFLGCLFTGITGSQMPTGAMFWSKESSYGWRAMYVPGERAAMVPIVLEQIPMNARVASTDYIHTRLTHRERSYDYSDYLRAVSNYEDRVPDDTDFIVIDTGHRYSTIRHPDQIRELQREPEKWEVLPDRTNGWFIVLKRSADGR
ncbi:MAG: DUF2079 domain-containing protein [Planctomycetaceae bacterium]